VVLDGSAMLKADNANIIQAEVRSERGSTSWTSAGGRLRARDPFRTAAAAPAAAALFVAAPAKAPAKARTRGRRASLGVIRRFG
jgi:hypothetical protein